jgi:methionine synthase I (cobalamin-dependent)/5,10-methylenetetrahydrofolate reductase
MTDAENATETDNQRSSLAQALADGVVIFDGAMGTEIYRRHVFTNRCYDELNLANPGLIREVLTAYRDVGVDVLTSNTFAANRISLAKYGLADQVREINQAGARIARQLADENDSTIFVAGDVGPMPSQPQYDSRVEEMIAEQVEALLDGGADFILFETIRTRQAMERIAQAMRALPGVPFVLSFAILDSGETIAGESVARMLAPLPEGCPTPVAMGMNCGTGPDALLNATEKAVRLTELPLIVMPNAGIPKEVDDRKIYLASPEYVTEYAKRFVSLGVAGVGGCCGIGPEHMAEVVRTVRSMTRSRVRVALAETRPEVEEKTPTPLAKRSRLAYKLSRGQWATSVELLPPRGYDLTGIVNRSKTLYRTGVDCVNIPDGPRASSRISSLIASDRIQREAQIEVILHFCCRDKNLIAMQADLLACAACGIHNILFVTGDPPKLGNYPSATGVFDTDSIGMSAVQARLNRGIDLGGQACDPPTNAVIGVGLDPTALDRELELDRFRQKVEAGAEFAITQPVFDSQALLRFLDDVEADHQIPIMAGIWPLASLRNAAFMQNEVPGVEIPDAIMQRMASVESRDDQLEMGVEIARESVGQVRDRVAGIQVSAPFGRISTALDVLAE